MTDIDRFLILDVGIAVQGEFANPLQLSQANDTYRKQEDTMNDKKTPRPKQVNIRFSDDEYNAITQRATDRGQRIQEFLRDLLQFGMLPEPVSRR